MLAHAGCSRRGSDPPPEASAGPAPCPTAYGYIALEDDDEAEIGRLHDKIVSFADGEGFTLVEVYVDRNIAPGGIIRPGMDVLLGEVSRVGGCSVLVPAPYHLSPSLLARRAIELEIASRGGRVLILAGTADTHAESRGNGTPGDLVDPRPPPPVNA